MTSNQTASGSSPRRRLVNHVCRPRALRGLAVRLVSMTLGIAAAIPWLRSRAHHRAVRAARSSARVVFVCYGNLNRSAVAAQLARQRWAGREILEAGHHAVARAPSAEVAVQAAHDVGVDLSAHGSTALSADLLAGADAIFVFDARDLIVLATRLGTAAGKLHLLGALIPDGPIQISDPNGSGDDAYKESFSRISKAISTTM